MTGRTSRRRSAFRAAALATAAVASLSVAACGSDDEKDKGKNEGKGGGVASKTTIDAAVSGGGKKFTLTAPKTSPGGLVTLNFTNKAKEPHGAQLVKVDGNQTLAQVLKELDSPEGAPTPPWLHGAGGLGTVKPGETATSVQNLTPGRYFLVDVEEPEGENVEPYAKQGAVAEITVDDSGEEGELPKTDATIVASEYKFTIEGLKAGTNNISYQNAGKELHHVILAPIAPGKTFADAKKAFLSEEEPTGPPPIDFENIASTAVTDGGVDLNTTVTLKKGNYAAVCFISDRAGGPPHVAKGMIQEVVVE